MPEKSFTEKLLDAAVEVGKHAVDVGLGSGGAEVAPTACVQPTPQEPIVPAHIPPDPISSAPVRIAPGSDAATFLHQLSLVQSQLTGGLAGLHLHGSGFKDSEIEEMLADADAAISEKRHGVEAANVAGTLLTGIKALLPIAKGLI